MHRPAWSVFQVLHITPGLCASPPRSSLCSSKLSLPEAHFGYLEVGLTKAVSHRASKSDQGAAGKAACKARCKCSQPETKNVLVLREQAIIPPSETQNFQCVRLQRCFRTARLRFWVEMRRAKVVSKHKSCSSWLQLMDAFNEHLVKCEKDFASVNLKC